MSLFSRWKNFFSVFGPLGREDDFFEAVVCCCCSCCGDGEEGLAGDICAGWSVREGISGLNFDPFLFASLTGLKHMKGSFIGEGFRSRPWKLTKCVSNKYLAQAQRTDRNKKIDFDEREERRGEMEKCIDYTRTKKVPKELLTVNIDRLCGEHKFSNDKRIERGWGKEEGGLK